MGIGFALVCGRDLRYGLPMRAAAYILALFLLLAGCEDTNVQLATEASMDAVRALTLSDAQVRLLAGKAADLSDRQHRSLDAASRYHVRLSRLTRGIPPFEDGSYNIKSYLDPRVNAFAMADGSIRIYTGLMERMNDAQLLFVIGHEMGHVAENHVKNKMMVAYAASALRKGVASQENLAGFIASSALGGLVEALANARFSRQEEEAADDYGLEFLKTAGFSDAEAVDAAAGALERLAGGSDRRSLLASHPHPEDRARRLRSVPGQEGAVAQIRAWFYRAKNRLTDRLSSEKAGD